MIFIHMPDQSHQSDYRSAHTISQVSKIQGTPTCSSHPSNTQLVARSEKRTFWRCCQHWHSEYVAQAAHRSSWLMIQWLWKTGCRPALIWTYCNMNTNLSEAHKIGCLIFDAVANSKTKNFRVRSAGQERMHWSWVWPDPKGHRTWHDEIRSFTAWSATPRSPSTTALLPFQLRENHRWRFLCSDRPECLSRFTCNLHRSMGMRDMDIYIYIYSILYNY